MKNRQISEDVKHNLDVLLGHLMGERNRLQEMGKRQILPDMLKPYSALHFEHEVLSAIYLCTTPWRNVPEPPT